MIEVITTKIPSLWFTTIEAARNEAEKHNVEVCSIIYAQKWCNETMAHHHMGYGLYADGKLLSSRDFISV